MYLLATQLGPLKYLCFALQGSWFFFWCKLKEKTSLGNFCQVELLAPCQLTPCQLTSFCVQETCWLWRPKKNTVILRVSPFQRSPVVCGVVKSGITAITVMYHGYAQNSVDTDIWIIITAFWGDGVFNELQPTADEEPGESKKTPVGIPHAGHFPKDSILLVPNSQHALRHSSRPKVIASAFVRFSEEGAGDHRGGAVGGLVGGGWKLDMVEKGLEIWSWKRTLFGGMFQKWS